MQDADIEAMRRGAETPVEAGEADLDAVADDLAAAFTDDAMFDWFLRTDARRAAARQRFFRYLVRRVAFGVGRIERPAVGGAAAIWMPFEFVGPMPLLQELRLVPMLPNATGFVPLRAPWRRCARTWTSITPPTDPTPICGSWA